MRLSLDTFYVCLALKGADTMSSMKINKNLAASIGFVIAVSVLLGGVAQAADAAEIDITASDKITELINNILKIIYALSGFSIIGMVILGGIQYSSSNGNPQAVSSAKKKIQGAVLALVVLALLYPFLQWIIPGGSFN